MKPPFSSCYDPKLITEPKTFHIQNRCALGWPAPPLSLSFLGFRYPHARGDEVSMATEPRAQSYSQSQRSWVVGSSPSVSRGQVRPAACTAGPATHRLRIPDPTRQGVFTKPEKVGEQSVPAPSKHPERVTKAAASKTNKGVF